MLQRLSPALLLIVCLGACLVQAQPASPWRLVWSDEFDGPAGAPPDSSKWNYDLGGGGWGNQEIEIYTNSPANAFLDGQGRLIIRAIRDADGRYTSARLQTGAPRASTHTADGAWLYGRIEVRAKLPSAKGVWPAFWTLGENFASAGWPSCGEIDIMENFGTFRGNRTLNNATLHGPGYSGAKGLTQTQPLPDKHTVDDGFHVYGIEWSPDSIEWNVDGDLYHKLTPASLPASAKWVFNAPQFLLLNLAIGGPRTFLGTPDAETPFPQEMAVDWVRIYQR